MFNTNEDKDDSKSQHSNRGFAKQAAGKLFSHHIGHPSGGSSVVSSAVDVVTPIIN